MNGERWLKAELRKILLDMLADGKDISDGDADAWNSTWKVDGNYLDQLCQLVGLRDVEDAFDSIHEEVLREERKRP